MLVNVPTAMPLTTRQRRPRVDEASDWLERFHAGDRATLAAVYHDHVGTITAAVGRMVTGVDRETVVHDVFLRLLSREEVRRAFQGGSLGSWLVTVARNQAIDHLRHRSFEVPTGMHIDRGDQTVEHPDERLHARLLVAQFEREVLPPRWVGVFHARFLSQLDQSEAARRLGMSRTTLAYQEYRIRRLLRRFLLKGAL